MDEQTQTGRVPWQLVVLVLAGWAVLVAGVALIYVPAGLIVAGVTLAAAGILLDDGVSTGRSPATRERGGV